MKKSLKPFIKFAIGIIALALIIGVIFLIGMAVDDLMYNSELKKNNTATFLLGLFVCLVIAIIVLIAELLGMIFGRFLKIALIFILLSVSAKGQKTYCIKSDTTFFIMERKPKAYIHAFSKGFRVENIYLIQRKNHKPRVYKKSSAFYLYDYNCGCYRRIKQSTLFKKKKKTLRDINVSRRE